MSGWKVETYTTSELAEKIKNKELSVPPYQRGQVWNEKQEDFFIDSIKNKFPFGSILLYKRSEGDYQLIDGLQRTTTICRYLNNPTKYLKHEDLSEEFLDKIYSIIGISGNEKLIKEKISEIIVSWLKTECGSMDKMKNINYNNITLRIKEQFPVIAELEKFIEVSNEISENLKNFVNECETLAQSEVPAIIYEGDASNLPEIFMRINSKGTHLSKYQILAATWTNLEYKIVEQKLSKINEYVSKFYQTLTVNDFSVVGFSDLDILNKPLNLYQIVFGFGKLLTEKFPLLFGKIKKDKDVDSCSFNLINACLANKNSKLKDLPQIFKQCFKDEKEVNVFLLQILNSAQFVEKQMKAYLSFKLNSREESQPKLYHTEMQICSMIANVHNASYLELFYNEEQQIIGRKVCIGHRKQNYDSFKKQFKRNAIKRYVSDILDGNWTGTGDKKMDDISVDFGYYTDEINRNDFERVLDHWYYSMSANRKEFTKVKQPDSDEKLLLSLIYLDKFNAYEALSDLRYDIEHLATKGLMKKHLKNFSSDEKAKLPISSFGNLCILPEKQNRSKKDKTLYMDSQYISKVINKKFGNEILTLDELETRFTFTTKSQMEWCEKNYTNFEELKKDYENFINDRYNVMKKYILKKLNLI